MSHGFKPSINHSWILFLTADWSFVSFIHFCKLLLHAATSKNKCSLSLMDGFFPEKIDLGFISSVASYVAPQISQLSPYWFFAPHFGHSPWTYLSARNNPLVSSKSCLIFFLRISPFLSALLKMCSLKYLFSSEWVV